MWILRHTVGVFIELLLGYKCVREKGPYTPSIIIANHNTDLDPALITKSFTGHMYFLASEHAFRKGLFSKFLSFVFEPISFNKVKADTASLKELFNRVKAGHNVCLFAEGNRSHNGLTGNIPLSTAKLVKMSGAALITYRFEGGYFTTPRWAKKMRRGKMTGRVMGRYSAEELKSMTAEQVYTVIKRDIHEDAYERQRENPVIYRGKDLAENIETALYLCPGCEKIGTIRSRSDRFFCDCGLNARYTETGFLESAAEAKGAALRFSTITEWDKWQLEQLTLMVNNAGEEPLCMDDNQKLFIVKSKAESTLVGEGPMHISRTEFHCAGMVFPLQQINQFAIIDRTTLIFALKDGTQYELRSDVPRSALKYVEIFRILRNE